MAKEKKEKRDTNLPADGKCLPTAETIPPRTHIGLGPCLMVMVATSGAKNQPNAHETTIAHTEKVRQYI